LGTGDEEEQVAEGKYFVIAVERCACEDCSGIYLSRPADFDDTD